MSDYKATFSKDTAVDPNLRVAFVTGEFNRDYTKRLEDQNEAFLKSVGISAVDKFVVPGAFEIPGFAKRLLKQGHYDLILCLGVVVRGATPHFDYVCGESARKIMDLTTKYDTPIIFGILTCNTFEQVDERINDHFAKSGLTLVHEITKIPLVHHVREPIGKRFSAIVVHGNQHGRTIGFPTANTIVEGLELEEATYEVRCTVDAKSYTGAGSYRGNGLFESHLLDFDGDLYGKTLEVEVLYKIRENVKFANMKELKRQIEDDVGFIRQHTHR